MTDSSTTQTSTTETTVEKVEDAANTVGTIAAAVGGEAGQIADAAIEGAENVTNTVTADVAAHHSIVQTAGDAAAALISSAPTIAANLPAETAAKVTAAAEQATGFLALLREAEAEIKSFFTAL